jgi:hypothetical protein
MSYPYNYFITKKNISKHDLEDVSYIFNKNLYNNKSILELYRKEINEYIENNKIKIYEIEKNNFILSKLSKYYNDYLIKVINPNLFNPKLFFTFFIDYKFEISNNINNINLLKKLFESITIKNTKEYNEKTSFINPLNYYYLTKINQIDIESIIDKKYINLYHLNKSTNFISNINKTIQILIQGNIINLSLPTIGIIYNQFNNENIKSTIVDFIEKIVTIKEEKFSSICSHISLKELNLGNVFADILFKNNNTNNPVINTFKNMINNINVNLIDVLTIKSKNTTSKNIRLVKQEFIIPYKHIEKKNKDDIVLFEKNDYDKIKKSKDLIDKNNTIVIYVLNKIKNDPNKLITNNYKNVLACYLFYIINLTIEIYNVYIDKIDDFLKNLIESKHNLFTDLNVIEAFNYTSLFKKSIYKFKLILLNNFHSFFLPTQILNGSYGMKINDYGSYVPESLLLGDIEGFPFNIKDNSIFCDKTKLQEYILNISYKTDIYDKKNILEFGGNIYDFELMKRSMLILLHYYNNLEIKNNFNLFIINLLYDTWKNKNTVPMEIINDILTLDKNNKLFFQNNILLKYEDSIQKCVFYINIVQNIRNKIKSNTNNVELNRLENINLLSYVFYNMRCLSIITYIKNSFIDINLKNKILEQILSIKSKYEELISK